MSMLEGKMKICAKCKEVKELDCFRKSHGGRYYRSRCRPCEYEDKKSRRHRNSEQYNAYQRKYYSENPQQYENYREKYKEQQHHYNVRRWQEERPHIQAITNKSYIKNREKIRAYARSYRMENKTKVSERTIRYRIANPERVKAWKARDSARRRTADNNGLFTAQEWLDLCKKCNHRCLSCDKKTRLTVDHIVPVSKGGSSDIENIQPLCKSCNSRKHDKTIDYRVEAV